MNRPPLRFKSCCKSVMNGFALGLTFPCAGLCWLEQGLHPGRDELFVFFGQLFALLPGLAGMYVRRGFYRQTLQSCADDVFIGFGTYFTQRSARVATRVYIGSYALLGSVTLGPRALIGSRASLLSGGQQHALDAEGAWTATDRSQLRQIEIGADAWLGEAAVVIANVGAGAMVAAGSVVATPVPEYVMVAGNPARFVKHLQLPPRQDDERAAPDDPKAANCSEAPRP